MLLELAGELEHEAHARRGERVADRDGAAPWIHARVLVVDSEVVEEAQHLHGERLVELEEPDVLDHFGIADDDERVNPWGGAIATGHPLASSGVRLMTQLARHFEEHPEVRYGLTAMCIGIGMGGCVIWENPHHVDATAGAESADGSDRTDSTEA